jgi:hypothetical protein
MPLATPEPILCGIGTRVKIDMRLKPRILALLVASIATVAAATSGAAEASRPLRDDLKSAAVAEPTGPIHRGAPNDAEATALVRETLQLFVRAVAEQDMGLLRAEATIGVQRQLSVEEINQTFRPFFAVGLEADMLDGLEPVILSSRPIGSDGVAIEGYMPTEPQALSFRLSFVREGLVWRWSYIHVAVMQAGVKPGQ